MKPRVLNVSQELQDLALAFSAPFSSAVPGFLQFFRTVVFFAPLSLLYELFSSFGLPSFQAIFLVP